MLGDIDMGHNEKPTPGDGESLFDDEQAAHAAEGSPMTLRSGHGNGAGVPRVEVLPADELPAGIPAPAREELPTDRGARGKFAPGNSLAGRGGKARNGTTKLAARLGLQALLASSDFAQYQRSAVTFRKAQCSELARTVGGGVCGPGPSSVVASAAWQLAASRFLFERAAASGDTDLMAQASRLADASRQNLLAAHELCAKEAQARGRKPTNPLAGYLDTKGTNDG